MSNILILRILIGNMFLLSIKAEEYLLGFLAHVDSIWVLNFLKRIEVSLRHWTGCRFPHLSISRFYIFLLTFSLKITSIIVLRDVEQKQVLVNKRQTKTKLTWTSVLLLGLMEITDVFNTILRFSNQTLLCTTMPSNPVH